MLFRGKDQLGPVLIGEIGLARAGDAPLIYISGQPLGERDSRIFSQRHAAVCHGKGSAQALAYRAFGKQRLGCGQAKAVDIALPRDHSAKLVARDTFERDCFDTILI